MNPIVRTVLKFLVEAVVNTAIFYVLLGLTTWKWGQEQLINSLIFGIGWSLFGGYITRFITKIFTPKKKEA